MRETDRERLEERETPRGSRDHAGQRELQSPTYRDLQLLHVRRGGFLLHRSAAHTTEDRGRGWQPDVHETGLPFSTDNRRRASQANQ